MLLLLLHSPRAEYQKHEYRDCEVIESLRKLDWYLLAFNPHAILKTWNKYNQIVSSG